MRKRVLFLCIHNTVRSQMAEAFLNDLGGDRYEAFSAGLEKGTINPMTYQVMAELGYDLAGHTSKLVSEFLTESNLNILVTVCARAEAHCPTVWPGLLKTRLYWPFDDPAQAEGSDEERLAVFRRVRDEIKQKIEEFLAVN